MDKIVYPNFKPLKKPPVNYTSEYIIVLDYSLIPNHWQKLWDIGWRMTSESKIQLLDVDE